MDKSKMEKLRWNTCRVVIDHSVKNIMQTMNLKLLLNSVEFVRSFGFMRICKFI